MLKINEATQLPASMYHKIENAIFTSKFWLSENEPEDSEWEEYLGLSVEQTPAAIDLQDTLNSLSADEKWKYFFIVMTPDATLNPNTHGIAQSKNYPHSLSVGGEAEILKNNVPAILIFLGTYSPEYGPGEIKPKKLVSSLGGVIRHEIVHLKQYEKRAQSDRSQLLDAQKAFRSEPWSIPSGEDTEKHKKYKEKNPDAYRESKIEIDAHAHQAADELLDLMNLEDALDLIRNGPDESILTNLPAPLKKYYLDPPKKSSMQRFKKQLYKQLISLSHFKKGR